MSHDPLVCLAASKALGSLSTLNTTLTGEFVVFELERALEWLSSSLDHRRFCAVSVIAEFSLKCPLLLSPFVFSILDLLWLGLRDVKVWNIFTLLFFFFYLYKGCN